MKSAGLELVPIKSQSEHPASKCVFLVVGDRFLCGCLALCQSLMRYRKAELYVCLGFSCVKGAVEKSEFDRSLGKCCVKVQSVVSGLIVMLACAMWVFPIPDFLKLLHRSWLSSVDGFKKLFVCLLAVAEAVRINLQCPVKDVFLARYNVHNVP